MQGRSQGAPYLEWLADSQQDSHPSMSKAHIYEVTVNWTGNRGSGTHSYAGYSRAHEISCPPRPPLPGSSDPAFRGEAGRWNPELLLVAALSECHLLWYLHLCSAEGVVVTSYVDRPRGTMIEDPDGSGRFTEVVLRPLIDVADATMVEAAIKLHDEAHRLCFIANSVNFPVTHEPEIGISGAR